LFYTSWPILIFATQDQEYTKEVLIRNPKLYHDGPQNVHLNAWEFWKWTLHTLTQSALVLFICVHGLAHAPDTLGGGGKTPDLWLTGTLLFGAVVCIVNNTLLQDSSSLNWLMLTLTILSTLSFFVVFWAVSQFQWDEAFGEFYQFWMYPQILLVFAFFALFAWPIQAFTNWWFQSKKKEARQIQIERNAYKKELDDGEVKEAAEQESKARPAAGHTGFAFSGEEGHVPQITENLKETISFDQDE